MPTTSPISGWRIPADSDPLGDIGQAIRNLVDDIEAGWTAYTATWTASTTNPVIGNGTIVARYKRVGKTVLFRVTITMGSTTTYGAGQYSIGLPFAAHASGIQLVEGDALVAGSAYPIRGRVAASGTTTALYCSPTTAGNGDRQTGPTTPATFANGSTLTITGKYEAA
jgi:hypothetical protein